MGIQPTYEERNLMRQKALNEATMNFVAYFMSLGDDLPTAQQKVAEVSSEVAQWLYPYVLGNTQPLINALDSSTLPQMTPEAKDQIIGDLIVTI